MATLLRGVRGVRSGLMQFIGQNIMGYIDQAEQQWNTEVVRPNRIELYEAVSFEHTDVCIMAISVGQSSEFTTVDVDHYGARSYRPAYDIQVFTWCQVGYEEDGETSITARVQTLAKRDDIAAVVRTMILDHPELGQPDGAFELIENTLVEEYSLGEATHNSSGRWLAGVVHNFTVRVEESLLRTTDYNANTIITDVDKLTNEP